MNCESCEDMKNSRTAPMTGRALMSFAGVKDAAKRQEVIAYLKSL